MANKPKKQTQEVVPGRGVGSELNLLALTGEIGWKLALPLLVMMLIGIKLDRAYHTTPLFMLLGMALSLSTSIILIGRMIARLNRHDKDGR